MTDYNDHIIRQTATIREAMVAINRLKDGVLTLLVINDSGVLQGSLTDGDIRRGLIAGVTLQDCVEQVMNPSFHAFSDRRFSMELIRRFRENRYSLIPYLNDDGTIRRLYDLRRKRSILPVDAVLMAGGRGERLRPMTDTLPKPLLKIGNKCIIDHNVDRLAEFGIENIYITVNYKAELLKQHFAERKDPDIAFHCIEEPQPLGTIGSVRLIDDFKEDTVLVMNSDLFTNINYEDFFTEFLNEQADMAVATVPYSVNVPYAIMQLSGNEVTGFEEKPNYTYYANAGIYLIKKELLKLIPADRFFHATDMIQLLIENRYKVVRFPIMGYWLDIGKPDDFKKAQELVKHKTE